MRRESVAFLGDRSRAHQRGHVRESRDVARESGAELDLEAPDAGRRALRVVSDVTRWLSTLDLENIVRSKPSRRSPYAVRYMCATHLRRL